MRRPGNQSDGSQPRRRPFWVATSKFGLFCFLTLRPYEFQEANAAESWHEENGYRFRTLELAPEGHTGFSLLPSDQTQIAFSNILTSARAAENQIRLNGSGVALGDIDGDGWCDIYLCGLENRNGLYRNLGGWNFANVTDQAGVACNSQYSSGAAFSDVDGDGDLDLLVNGIGVGTRLFLNNGRGTFAEGVDSGLDHRHTATTSALSDIDGDGMLDLYVANYRTTTIRTTGFAMLKMGSKKMLRPEDRDDLELTPEGRVLENGEPDFLYRNLGGGKFTTLPWTEGVFLDEYGKPLAKAPRDWGLAVLFRDLDDDGAPDIYVCNDFQSPDRIWINDGHGRFHPIVPLAIRHTSTFSMSADLADLNRDGLDDIFTADMLGLHHSRRIMQQAAADPFFSKIGIFDDRPQTDQNVLQVNRGDGTYAEIARYAGLEASEWTWSAIFIDVDLDGYEDLLCATGQMFDTQDLDAEARIYAKGPWRRDLIPQKLLEFPPLPMKKVTFRNRGNLTFEEIGSRWGFDQVGISHGMALADLDNDGDLDVVVNNLNSAVGIYRNESSAPRVGVRLKGLPPNTRGIGAKLWLYGGAVPMQSQEMICGGRYLSSDDPMRVFAAGRLTNSMRLEVKWRNGKRSIVRDIKANRIYEIDEKSAEASSAIIPPQVTPIFEEVSQLLKHEHHEEDFDDFARQPLLPRKLSQLGPGVSWTDLDGDGWEDLVIGSGKGGRLAAFRNDGKGGFIRMTNAVLGQVVMRDQTAVIGLGGGKILVGAANYEDGLTTGGGVQEYDLVKETIADVVEGGESSVGPIIVGDLDGDGDLDLFVGGRVIGGKYPEPAHSRIYRSERGKWILDTENTKRLERVGLVSGAVWSDLDGDGFPELILGCEWGPVRVYHNTRGQLKEVTKELGLENYTGWWNGVTTGDLDGDGKLDIIASNWGTNTKYSTSPEHPRKLYYGDLDKNGTLEIVEAYYDGELQKEVPSCDLNSAMRAMPSLREKFRTYAAYGTAGIQDIYGVRLGSEVRATTLASTLFLNRGDHFEALPLPPEAQWSPAFGICISDMDGDGKEDIFLSQNFFAVTPDSGRNDAGRGLWLRGDGKGALTAISGMESGVKVYAEQRGAVLCDFDHEGRIDLVVTQNGGETKLFRNTKSQPGLRVRFTGTLGNIQGIGVLVRAQFGERLGPAREVKCGSGYWSQDSVAQVLGRSDAITGLSVRWPGGYSASFDVPPGAREVLITPDAALKVIP